MTTAAPGRAGRAVAPFFSKESVIRRVHSEAIVLLGGGRALLMQVAHPAVAKGVAEHSSFRQGKRARLLRTLRPTLAIVFGTEAQASEAAAAVNAMHSRVAGDGYRADDPQLLFWVLATLIDTALLIHERFLRPLSEADAHSYYRDVLRAGELLGVRPELAPPDLDAFRAYMDGMLGTLEVCDGARSIAGDLFSSKGATAIAGWGLRELTAGLLPPGLREAYGMAWSPRRDLAARLLARAARTTLRTTPRALRTTPWFLLPGAGPEGGGQRAARRLLRA